MEMQKNAQCHFSDCRSAPNRLRVIGELLLALGVLPHLRGFMPICEGIWILCETDRGRHVPFSDVLQWIDEMFGLPDTEHAMRDAIGIGFLNAGTLHRALFPFTARPSNAQFLCTLAEAVRDYDATNGRIGLSGTIDGADV